MKDKILLLIVTIAIVFPQPTLSGSERAPLLDDSDIELEHTERSGVPALSAASNDPDYWESFNQWICFDARSIELERITVRYDGQVKAMPQINANLLGHRFEISLSGDTEYDNEAVFSRWEELIRDSGEVCAYAAYLQELELTDGMPSSLWVVSGLKTENGYWKEREQLSANAQ